MSRTENPEVRQLLWGHVSQDTAYLIEDYPYGRFRTQKKVWIERATSGKGNGQDRVCEQTLNPKTGRWNNVHYSTYSHRIYMYLDQQGHVQYFYMTLYGYADELCRLHYSGLFDKLPEDVQGHWTRFEQSLDKKNPETWSEYKQIKASVEKYYTDVMLGTWDDAREIDCYAFVLNELGHAYDKTFKQIWLRVKYEKTKTPSVCVYN